MSSAIKTVVVPMDGSRHAAASMRYGERLGRLVGARVVMVHAFPDSPRALLERLGNINERAMVQKISKEKFSAMRDESARRAFANGRRRLPGDAVTVEEQIVDGDPADALVEFARTSEDPVIVMGRRGLGRVREFLVGSVSDAVVQSAACPVTVLTDDDEIAPEVMIVPVDGSDSARAAAEHAGVRARATGAAIHLVHIFPNSPREIPGVSGSMAELAGVGPFADESFAELGREAAEKAFAEARKRIGDGVEVVEVRRGGDAATAINAYSREVAPAEVIMGRRGLSRLERFLVGSVSRRVVHGAHGPVTVVR